MRSRASRNRLIVPASMAESVKAELHRITGVKRTTDGLRTEKKKGVYEKITPENKAEIGKYAEENGIAGRLK